MKGVTRLIDIREAIKKRLENKSKAELHKVMQDSMGAEERVLPGLGVLLEMVWDELDAQTQDTFVQKIYDCIHPHVTTSR